ncbi:Hsp20/alpha crystallin family protein [Jeotgalibacillus campisalis]|uniref:SHSP domain-containing protein n=1 Tax=Jeotgalibacillus campisalis TaxID=220754 RepID=A0A0C2S1K6_9BACL|nr:Hsp20/alpha crystallin family protein [Jeotgalibacillus campisalis]KIL47924.1 hypothetical protein KR50_20910 [Jeotgalibacillus campisalis]
MDFWQSLFPKTNSPNDWQEWLQKYMQQSFENQQNPNDPPLQPSAPQSSYTLFESFHYLFIHISIKNYSLNEIKVHHSLTQVLVHIPGEPVIKITLPEPISRKGATAEAKDGTLEIRLPKIAHQFEMELPIDSID